MISCYNMTTNKLVSNRISDWRNIMVYPFMTLNDNTEIVHSEMHEDGRVLVHIETPDETLNDAIYDTHIAASLGDSVLLLNSRYLKREFKGDTKKLKEFIPVFFNDKVAFLAYVGYGDNASLKNILFGDWVDVDYDEIVDYYYIDFINRKVIKVTPEALVDLLEDYHDLQMRYEGMKDYRKRYMIQEYFFKFVDRASQDFMRPYILDLVGSSSTIE